MSPPAAENTVAAFGLRTASELAAPRAPARRPRRLAGLALPALLLALWQALASAGVLPRQALPGPGEILATLGGLAGSGELWHHLFATAARVVAGFAAGAAAATALGLVTGQSARARRLLDPTFDALRSVPSLAWVPLFLLWMGIGEPSKVALIALGAFFPVYLALSSAIREVDPKLVEVGRVFRLGRLALVREVLVPAALPGYLVGLRGGLGLAWMFVVAAELMGASRGLGYLMVDGQTTSRPAIIIASLLLFALAGKASDGLLALAASRAGPRAEGG